MKSSTSSIIFLQDLLPYDHILAEFVCFRDDMRSTSNCGLQMLVGFSLMCSGGRISGTSYGSDASFSGK